jgi:putative salt-induced outer membrane protein YdiY
MIGIVMTGVFMVIMLAIVFTSANSSTAVYNAVMESQYKIQKPIVEQFAAKFGDKHGNMDNLKVAYGITAGA